MTGEELKEARRKLGLSQQGLAAAIGKSKTMIGYMERGYGPSGPIGIEPTTELAVWCLLYDAGEATPGDRAT
jgi:transcriptional regulator with XRE-family HTH domain